MFSIQSLHHFAWRCRDAEETRHFYEDILGLPLIHIVRADTVPSTGEQCPYVHLFFEMADGSCIAFFDLGDDTAAEPSPNTPAWVNHLALRVGSRAELDNAHAHLLAAGVEVVGPTDHHFVQSIYFFDPNGIRLELSWPVDDPAYMQKARAQAHVLCEDWTAEKQQMRRLGKITPAPTAKTATTGSV